MSDFKREERYTVVKHNDISTAQLQRLRSYLATNSMPTRTCVVVEPDWPIYGLVWQMIESLANGKVPIDPKVLAADLNAALEREQALAAHVARLIEAGNAADMCTLGITEEALEWADACEDAPSISLARRDALKQAEEVQRIADEFRSDVEGAYFSPALDDRAKELRQQAEGVRDEH